MANRGVIDSQNARSAAAPAEGRARAAAAGDTAAFDF
jgi:hypothetical protein